MLFKEPLDFAKEFIESINQCIEVESPGEKNYTASALVVIILHHCHYFNE
ncbi:hypothetical protein OQJ05_11160 [Fluoribacter gormanii]|nr:hypothetical protein [Fluoribacter gormanii]MCW8444610.1 hypothetical protein [Fluoribacter gormanii]